MVAATWLFRRGIAPIQTLDGGIEAWSRRVDPVVVFERINPDAFVTCQIEQQLVGEMVAARLPLLFKLASVVPVGEITRNSERAATEQGLEVKVFDDESAAMSWLLEGKPS